MSKEKEVVETEIELDECAMCTSCKEWANIVVWLEDGEEVERVSGCCTAPVYEF